MLCPDVDPLFITIFEVHLPVIQWLKVFITML